MSDERSAQRYLEDLTPGGSEYYNNPKRCFEWASGRIEATHRIALDAALERNRQRDRADAAEAQVARLQAALLEQWGAAHEERCGSLPEICDANPSGCAWRMPSALAPGEPSAESILNNHVAAQRGAARR